MVEVAGLGGLDPRMPFHLPWDAPDPASFCARSAALSQALGGDMPTTTSPVFWLTSPMHLQRARGPPPVLPHVPLWWAGEEWHEFPEADWAPHAQAHSAYAPRRFEPPRHSGGLLRVVNIPGEAGPEDGHALPCGSTPAGVVCALRVLLCEREGKLWARPRMNGEWRVCPYDFDFYLARTEAFEVNSGDQYVFLFRTRSAGPGSLATVLSYDLRKNEWLPPVGATRSKAWGQAGEAPVRWRPVDAPRGRTSGVRPRGAPLRAWLLESTPEYLVVLASVSRDGVQRGLASTDDEHSAVHFLGRDGEVVSHHLACNSTRLTAQRYDEHFLFAKDCDEHPADQPDACMDDNWHPLYPRVAGWLLSTVDVSVPPFPLHLPDATAGWGGAAASWSLAISRGCLEDMAAQHHLKLDTAPRAFLLESVDGSHMRVWASRRIDDAAHTVYDRRTFDGQQMLRHALTFEALRQTELEIEESPESAAFAMWTPDLRHAARVGPEGKLAFWRCGVSFAGAHNGFKTTKRRAQVAATHDVSQISSVEVFPRRTNAKGGHGWEVVGLPAIDARHQALVLGLPNFPAMRWGDPTFERLESRWNHPIGRDAAQHVPTEIYR